MFGLIKRNCYKLNKLFECVYLSLIKFHLEYSTIIWETHIISHSNLIKGINFLRYISFKCNIKNPQQSGNKNILLFLNLKLL